MGRLLALLALVAACGGAKEPPASFGAPVAEPAHGTMGARRNADEEPNGPEERAAVTPQAAAKPCPPCNAAK